MYYLVAGILKPGAEPQILALHNEWNEHLSQPFQKISLFGALRNKDGGRKGYLAVIQAASFEDAETFLERSPFYENDLYERVEVAEFSLEVGNLE